MNKIQKICYNKSLTGSRPVRHNYTYGKEDHHDDNGEGTGDHIWGVDAHLACAAQCVSEGSDNGALPHRRTQSYTAGAGDVPAHGARRAADPGVRAALDGKRSA